MENFKLILSTAIVFAVGDAFPTGKQSIQDEYVLIGSTFQLMSSLPPGHCQISPGKVCDYIKINPSGNNIDPSNFTPLTINAEFVED